MDKLKFYRIDENYLNYLKGYDKQVPDNVEKGNAKPFCGIIFEIGDFKYYAPISSFSERQKTNVVIYDGEKAISSVRFCFMIPVPDDVLTYLDFSQEKDSFYKDLLEKEYKYCKGNLSTLYNKAIKVYKIGCNRKHFLAGSCCDFNKLEDGLRNYVHKKSAEEVASTFRPKITK